MANLYISKLKRRHASAATQTRSLKAIANAALVLIDLYGVKNGAVRVFDNLPVAGAVVAWSNVHAALKTYGMTETVGAVVNSTVPTPVPVPVPTPVPNPTPVPTPVPNPTPTPVPNPTPTPTEANHNYFILSLAYLKDSTGSMMAEVYKLTAETLIPSGLPVMDARAFFESSPINRGKILVRSTDCAIVQSYSGDMGYSVFNAESPGNVGACRFWGTVGVVYVELGSHYVGEWIVSALQAVEDYTVSKVWTVDPLVDETRQVVSVVGTSANTLDWGI